MANTYFLRIDGIDGDATEANHTGWFEIDAYDFEIFRAVTLAGTSKVTFDPLVVTAKLGDALADLFSDLANGKVFKSVELEGVNSAGKVFYDLNLTDAGIVKVDEGNNAAHTVAFDFSKVALTTTEFDSTGKASTPQTFAWDLSANGTFDYSGIADLGDGTPAAASNNQYFLRIDGIEGDSTDANYKGWFEIDTYDFEIFRAAASAGGGSKATFAPLVVTADLNDALADLFNDIASGTLIKTVELEGVNQNGKVFYDLTLSNAGLVKVDEGNNAKDSVAFDYAQVALTTTEFDSTGKGSTPHTFAWNLATSGGTFDYSGIAGLGDSTPAAASGNQYFLRIDGIDGDSTDADHKGWFEIDAYDFEVFRTAASGGGSKATFDPLAVTAELGNAIPDLFQALANGKIVKTVELEGVNTSGKVFYDLTLSDAAIIKVEEGNNAKDTVAFDFSKVALTTTEFDSSGKPPTLHTFVWDLAASGGTLDYSGIPGLGDTTPAAASGNQYFLRVDGIDGGSTDKNHKGWFEIDAYDFEVFRAAGLGGGGTKATFDPFVVTADLGDALADLLDRIASGKILKTVEFEGVNQNGKVFYDLTLSNAGIVKVDEGNEAKDTVAFDYSQVALTTTEFDSAGTATTHNFAWNLAVSGATFDYTGLASLGDDTPTPPSSNKYFLRIDGIDGDATDKNYKGWFEIDAYDFEIFRGVALGGGGSKASFEPLAVTADLGGALADLFDGLANGKILKTVELEGVNQNGKVFYDLALTDAGIVKIDEGNNAKSTIAFDFAKVALTTTEFDSAGNASTPHVFAWDLSSGGSIDYSGIAGLGDGTPAEASSDKYFLRIDGITGDSTDANHKGWFEIDTYDFEMFREAALGGGGSKVTLDPLVITAELDAGLVELFQQLASSKVIKSVELEGARALGNVFYDLTLFDVQILKVDEGTDGKDTIEFGYSSFAFGTNSTAVIAVPGDAPGERGVGTAAVEHFVGTELTNPSKPWKLVSYENSIAAVSVNLATHTSAASTATGGFAEGDFFTDINAITGSGNNDSLTGNAVANLLTGGAGIDILSGGGGDDIFAVRAGDTGAGESYDGGGDTDTLRIDGGGAISLNGITFSNMENLVVTNAAVAQIILSTAQINAFTGTFDAQGAADTFAVTDLAFLTTFATPATRSSAFTLIKHLLDGGVENVEWQEAGATNIATKSGANIVVTTTDPAGSTGGLSWVSSIFTFDAAGNRLSKVTTLDDGSVTTRSFGTGPNADILFSDVTTGIIGPLNSTSVIYDTAGRVDTRTITYDAGGSTSYSYDDAGRIDSRTDTTAGQFITTTFFNDSNQRITVFYDDSLSNQYSSWMSSTLTLDPLTGRVTQKFTVLDDGNTVIENYIGGALSTRIVQDGGANEAFSSSRQFYSAGVLNYQATAYDNGTGLIIGTDAANTITTLYGIADAIIGKGGADTFVFDIGMGADRILDFQDGIDRLDFTTIGIDSLADLSFAGATVSQTGADVVVDLGSGDVLTIKNLLLANFTDADFKPLV